MVLYRKKQNGIKGLLFCLLALITIDVWLLSTGGYGYARFAAMLFLLLGVCLPIEQVFYLFLFSFPFSGALKLTAGGITVLPLLSIIVILRLLWKKQVRVSKVQILAVVGLLFLQLLSVLFYNAPPMNVGSFFISLLFVICSASYFKGKEDQTAMFIRASVFYVAGVMTSVILSDLFPNALYVIERNKQVALEYDGRFGAIFVEPNEFSQAVLVGVGLLITIFPMLRKTSHKAAALAALIYLCFSGYRSVSKSYVLTLLGMFVVFILLSWYQTGKTKGTGRAVLTMIPGMFVLAAGAWVIFEKVVIPTFDSRNRSDFLTGRGEIWLHYLDALFQRVDILLWGAGMGNMNKLADTVAEIGDAVSHNTYLEYLIQLGILGLILLVGILLRLIKQNAYKLSTYFVLVLAAYFVTAFGISSNANDCIFIVLLLTATPMGEKNPVPIM